MASKKILIVNGHPNPDSFNFAIAAAYKNGLIASGAEWKEIIINDLKFEHSLKFGHQKRVELE
ncbi:MAG: flavodoxin family protein, partial [Sphingobacteriales bacterium]